MNGHAISRQFLAREESTALLHEKPFSDIEGDVGRTDVESKFLSQQWFSTAKAYVAGLRSFPWCSSFLRTSVFILPSFIQSSPRDPRARSSERLGPTSYLDGVRGLAALFVFFCHYFYTSFIIAQGYGFGGTNYHVLKLPIVRLFYQGPAMVAVFFVVSGYALSLKPLRLAHSRSFDSFASTITSFVFRRAIRLFVPAAVSTFMVVVLLRLGMYEWTREFARDPTFMRNVMEMHPERLETTKAQLVDWGRAMFDFVHVWGWEKFGGSTAYDVHLWTVPVEFRCSMVLFLTLVGTARLRTGIRFLALGVLMWFAYRSDRWEMLLFYCGMALAELDIIRGAHGTNALPSTAEPHQLSLLGPLDLFLARRAPPRAKALFWIGLSVLALYLMSQPDQGSEATPGWAFLSSLIPDWFSDRYRYWQCVGSVLFVLCVGRSPAWQRLFNSGIVQYFGKISYAIYLMHGPVLHTAGYSVERWAWGLTGVEGQAYNSGFVLASLLVVPLVVWAADVFWRVVDAPTVRFAKWFEARYSITD